MVTWRLTRPHPPSVRLVYSLWTLDMGWKPPCIVISSWLLTSAAYSM